jgi:hypothetical protein
VCVQSNLRPPSLADYQSGGGDARGGDTGLLLCMHEFMALRESLSAMSHRFRYYLTMICVMVLTEMVRATKRNPCHHLVTSAVVPRGERTLRPISQGACRTAGSQDEAFTRGRAGHRARQKALGRGQG